MFRKGFTHIVSLSLITLLTFFVACSDSGSGNKPLIEKPASADQAPDFTLQDIEGKTFKLSNFKGKPVMLIFTTTWCVYCRSEIPNFKKIYADYGSRGLEVVNINIDEPREKVARFAARYELPYRLLLDETGRVPEAYGVVGVPSLVLIDKDGKIICRQCRSVNTILNSIFPNY
jgi:peroxiredoxin